MTVQMLLGKLGFGDKPSFNRGNAILGQGDEVLIVTAVLLTLFGSVMVYSATYFASDSHVFTRHLVLVGIGLGAMFLGMFLDVYFWYKWARVALIAIAIMMFLQLVTPLGPEINHVRRWFDLKIFNLQTSEIARCVLIVYFARILHEKPEVVQRLDKNLLKLMIAPGVICGLIYLQPDFSSMLMLAAVLGIVLFLAGLPVKFFLLALGVVTPILLWSLKGYQWARILGQSSYQHIQAIVALVNGGLTGEGLGQGFAPIGYLPEAHNDFIYAVIGEELGWFGTAGILAAVALLFIRGVKICIKQPDRYGFLLGSGLIASLTLYALVNMGVNVGLLPITGLPLPFISKGGTSLVVSLWSVGVLWNLSRRAKTSG